VSPEHRAELALLGAGYIGPNGRHQLVMQSGWLVWLTQDPYAGSEFVWYCDGMQSGGEYGPTPRAAYAAYLQLRAEVLAARIATLQADAAEVAGELARVARLDPPEPAG
jgi:hypothetical protein